MKTKQRTLLLNEKQIKILDNVIYYMYESERQNFDEHVANGGKEESHILNEVSELERYCDSKLGEEWNKQ